MHKIIDKKFYLGPEFGLLINKRWITISELLQPSMKDLNAFIFERRLISLIVEGSPLSPGRIVWLDIWICISAMRNERDRTAVARISICFLVMADVEVQAEQVFAGINTQVPFTQCNESRYDSEAIGSNVVEL
jgi:hypothetical protein